MHTIKLADIVIKPERQRQVFDPDALQELKNSIEDGQLLHPPVLRQEGETWVLVAGERRLRAISEIYALGGKFSHNGQVFDDGTVPFTDVGELSEFEAEEAELDENLKRRDLTWQEHAAAVSRLNALRAKQKGAERDAYIAAATAEGIAPDAAVLASFKHTAADTAEELTGRRDGSYQDNIRKELIVARHLSNPEIAKAKSAEEAFKILKRQETAERNMELARAVGASFNADSHTLLNVDCLDFMADSANAERFDVILTDPPYGMGAQDFGDGAGSLAGIDHRYDDSFEAWELLMQQWASLSFKVAKPQAHAYVFCDFGNFHFLKLWMERAGWYVFRTPFVVHKLNSGRVPLPDQGPRRQYEILLYAIKGKKPVTHIYPDVIPVQGDANLGHGAQKPVALFQNLLQRSVRPGDCVLDSFAGTGTIFPAAHTMHCYATGLELNPEYFGMAVKRLQELKEPDSLLNSEAASNV